MPPISIKHQETFHACPQEFSRESSQACSQNNEGHSKSISRRIEQVQEQFQGFSIESSIGSSVESSMESLVESSMESLVESSMESLVESSMESLVESSIASSINSSIELSKDKRASPNSCAISYEPIAYIVSPFIRRNGCPRQSLITQHTFAYIDMPSASYIDQLEQYSHLWIIFHFSENRASHKRMTKIRPPRLNGKKVGIYASRAPHRINDIGLSLVRIHHVKGRRLYFNGIDLLHGTPVIDIKPYIPYADAPVGTSKFMELKNHISRELQEIQTIFTSESNYQLKDEWKESSNSPPLDDLKVNDNCPPLHYNDSLPSIKETYHNTTQRKVNSNVSQDKQKSSVKHSTIFSRLEKLQKLIDSIAVEKTACPSWVSQPQSTLQGVEMSDDIRAKIIEAHEKLEIYKDFSIEELLHAIEEILLVDPRSVYRKAKCQEQIWWIHFDRLCLSLRMKSEFIIEIINAEYCEGDYLNPDRFLISSSDDKEMKPL